jgi:putative endonuclease
MGTPSNYPPHVLGRRGERIATQHLRSAGWTVVARNYRFGRREVDLVGKGPLLAFVEVKTRAGGGCGHPEEAVTGKKRPDIEAVAAEYLVRNGCANSLVRFDVIAIEVAWDGRVTRLQHLEDA